MNRNVLMSGVLRIISEKLVSNCHMKFLPEVPSFERHATRSGLENLGIHVIIVAISRAWSRGLLLVRSYFMSDFVQQAIDFPAEVDHDK